MLCEEESPYAITIIYHLTNNIFLHMAKTSQKYKKIVRSAVDLEQVPDVESDKRS